MYALIIDGNFERWVDLRQEYPNTSFPSPITQSDLPENIVIVNTNIPAPVPEVFQVIERDQIPKNNNEIWELGWTLREMTDDEKQPVIVAHASSSRDKRNQLLTASDWTQLPDSPVDKTAWAEYRQLLRDVTAQEGFPMNINWPIMPT